MAIIKGYANLSVLQKSGVVDAARGYASQTSGTALSADPRGRTTNDRSRCHPHPRRLSTARAGHHRHDRLDPARDRRGVVNSWPSWSPGRRPPLLVLIRPPVRLNVANGFGSVWPGIAAAATVVLVVSEAVARRKSGCNPDVEKTAQPGSADCGRPSGCGNAQISVGPLISEHGLRRAHLGFLRQPRLTACCPIPGTSRGIPIGGAHCSLAD
jgi:hypothetical protein